MVTVDESKRIVQKGDCAWKVAARNLKTGGKNVYNADIMQEMKRLASLNGCDSVEEFNNKFFSSVGKEYVIGSNIKDMEPKAEPKQSSSAAKVSTEQTESAKADTIHVDNTKMSADSTRVDTTKIAKTPTMTVKTPQQAHADKINAMPSDSQRIIEHNKKNYDGKYYGIVDKKTCQLKIYDKQGNVVKSFTVGVGKSKGDGIGSYYMEHYEKTKSAYKAESQRFTTAGEFTLDEVKTTADAYTGKDGKPKIMHLKGDNRGVRSAQLALHMLYKPQYAQREAAIKSKGLEDNRMSYGCVNLTEEDWNSMHEYLGEGDKLYVLPEEKGNKLQLEKQKDGTYKFEQTYHKNDARGLSKEQASKVNYDVRPDRNPANIAKYDVAQTVPQKQKTHWYDPRTWFS